MSSKKVTLPIMEQPLRKGFSMESTGYLGNSRVVLNHFDAATQADIQHTALTYESEDEIMARIHAKGRRATALYSKQDIREQYCISDRGLGALETDRRSFFSCLSSHQNSPCSTRTSFLTVCVRQKIPSDENLQELCRRHPNDYAPYPTRRPSRYPWYPPPPEIYHFEEELERSYFRRKPRVDPRRYSWMPSDDESVRLERPRSVLDHCAADVDLPPPPPPATRPKHVSFARSHTLTSFDDAVVSLSASNVSKMTRSQERLLDVRKSSELGPITRQPVPAENALLEKLKRTPMKTQATQTEAGLGRKPLPAGQRNLSPRTVYRVKMVSQGAQTNGILLNGRKLMKSYSEAGSRFTAAPYPQETLTSQALNHEPLQRTQSDEPPRSPFMLTSPPPELAALSDSSSATRSSSESETKHKEIIIDFEPQIPFSPLQAKKPLLKTVSDGEILLELRKAQTGDGVVPQKALTSLSHENISEEPRNFTPFFQNVPIRNEGIFRTLEAAIFDRGFLPQDSLDEEFHENLIYRGIYLKRSGSLTSDDQEENRFQTEPFPEQNRFQTEPSPEDESVVPSLSLQGDRLSPFASNDSLANDFRDSDGIWNESQATVLQVDSGDNGTLASSSSLTAGSPGLLLLTPSARRKHLLLQHQQRSSFDTEALDEEFLEAGAASPRAVEAPAITVCGPSEQFLSARRVISPGWPRRTLEPASESPTPAVVPELLLARTDSGRTNTDVSESTTTTDDYITANSGTDSSRKSSAKGNAAAHATAPEGSSFESASSIYSLTRGDHFGDDMVVPSFSPPPIPEEASDLASTPVPEPKTGHSSPTVSSSSSGSYSLNGSCPELPQRPPVPSPRHVPSISEDDRSAHYSSSGYYESPPEDDPTWKSHRCDNRKEWTDDEKKRKKKAFTLEIAKTKSGEDFKTPASDKHKPATKHTRRLDDPTPASNSLLKTGDKPKRAKRTRSPMQTQRKVQQTKKSPSTLLARPPPSTADLETELAEEYKPPMTSDESSSGGPKITGQASPRKSKKFRDNNRRKSIPRSPTSSRSRRRSDSADEDKPSSLPGSLPRRKASGQRGFMQDSNENLSSSRSRLSPYSTSPLESPNQKRRSPKTSPEARLKALSAESLRSVSPGSDSVFYSDPSSHTAAAEHQVHCLHCGKEVSIVTTDDPDQSATGNGRPADIVQPPAGFADSPRTKHVSGRLYKKLEKRFRSEERPQAERKPHRYRHDVRAKSEERGDKPENCRVKLRPMARSTDASVEGLRATDSSPSVLPAAPDDEDGDLGLYNVPYRDGYWIYIDDQEELQAWSKQDAAPDEESGRKDSVSSVGSTDSEHEFRKRYQAVTHRMVHRKSCLEMYKRQALKSFAPESTTGEHESLRRSLEELLKLMLMIWCKENQAVKLITSNSNETDKTIIVRRQSGEFGFRIHGSKPVVVSAIEPDTPAECSGLEVGDIVLAVNSVSVLDKSHSEVVKIAHAGSDTLTLEVARTSGVLSPPSAEVHGGPPLYSGYLWKLGGYASGSPSNKWIRRWFTVKKDNCLYYYKTDSDKQPVGAMMLIGYDITSTADAEPGIPTRPFRLSLRRPGVPTLHLAADSEPAMLRWLEVLNEATQRGQMADTWLEQARRNLTVAPSAISKPDCFGYLVKLGNQWKSWSRRYCVLKDACLYFYQDATSTSAFGVACLHGYRVQQTASGAKKHAFEILPSEGNQKHFYFHTESDMDRKRWLAALEYSIDRWLKVG